VSIQSCSRAQTETHLSNPNPALSQVDQQRILRKAPRALGLLDSQISPILGKVDLNDQSDSIQATLVLGQQLQRLLLLPSPRQNSAAKQLNRQIISLCLAQLLRLRDCFLILCAAVDE